MNCGHLGIYLVASQAHFSDFQIYLCSRRLVSARVSARLSRLYPLPKQISTYFLRTPVRALLWLGGGFGDGLHAAGCGQTDGAAGLEAFEVTWSATTVSSTGTEWSHCENLEEGAWRQADRSQVVARASASCRLIMQMKC